MYINMLEIVTVVTCQNITLVIQYDRLVMEFRFYGISRYNKHMESTFYNHIINSYWNITFILRYHTLTEKPTWQLKGLDLWNREIYDKQYISL